MATSRLRQLVDAAAVGLLHQVDRDPYSRLRGCCDRRFWAWKLLDFPDATLQRAVQPLATALRDRSGAFPIPDASVQETIVSALLFAGAIQHADGSFDQAYPHEHSVGATAFLLDSMLAAYDVVAPACDAVTRGRLLATFERASGFLLRHDETHGVIANHVAGSVLALLRAEALFERAEYGARADALLRTVLDSQSPEGWFPEYGGCDPGYQTLCVYYLAQVLVRRPSRALSEALARSVAFLSHFVHPDGTFGGVYGSRRTAVYYAGGIALLAREHPIAARMTTVMLASADARRLLGPTDPDIGNTVPVLANYQLALASEVPAVSAADVPLPCEEGRSVDFPQAGLYLRGTSRTWLIVGASNGGTVAVFDRDTKARIHDDGGWVAEGGQERRWTAQVTTRAPQVRLGVDAITVTGRFHEMSQRVPGVLAFVILRLASVVLRWPAIGEPVKRRLVRMLLEPAAAADAWVDRTVRVSDAGVTVEDTLRGSGAFWRRLTVLRCGLPFNAIHMASAGYVVPGSQAPAPVLAPLDRLVSEGTYNVTSFSTHHERLI